MTAGDSAAEAVEVDAAVEGAAAAAAVAAVGVEGRVGRDGAGGNGYARGVGAGVGETVAAAVARGVTTLMPGDGDGPAPASLLKGGGGKLSAASRSWEPSESGLSRSSTRRRVRGMCIQKGEGELAWIARLNAGSRAGQMEGRILLILINQCRCGIASSKHECCNAIEIGGGSKFLTYYSPTSLASHPLEAGDNLPGLGTGKMDMGKSKELALAMVTSQVTIVSSSLAEPATDFGTPPEADVR
ncbi:hypothetical protein BDK51DRAFT_42121 [Blyttiomyces helicus]|uniref:Uncharacterized protein n=1 Tax=Blyttiomyces helicus TaxID=388810 RepID=A0A4P9VUK9_9FUNG|nr:hypothetical protein BDK51DRAFT_42121 [Blyttiomyces helicus]|eukprot:RKO82782.1 hypothetical protein BDK51DRAFT_42121 [Blyttiomyces helicus]